MKAVGFLEGAIIRYKELGFWGKAAVHHRSIAEIYEEKQKMLGGPEFDRAK